MYVLPRLPSASVALVRNCFAPFVISIFLMETELDLERIVSDSFWEVLKLIQHVLGTFVLIHMLHKSHWTKKKISSSQLFCVIAMMVIRVWSRVAPISIACNVEHPFRPHQS